MPQNESFFRRLTPLNAVNFLTAFKNTLLCSFFVLYRASEMGLGATQFYMTALWALLGMTVLAGLPSLLFLLPAGWAADRMPKRYTIMLCCFADLLIMLTALFLPFQISTIGMILILCFIVRAMMLPSLYGILPETFTEAELSRANGTTTLWRVIGLLAAIWVTWGIRLGNPKYVVLACAAVSLLTFFVSFKIRFTLNARGKYTLMQETFAGLRDIVRKPSMLLSCLGDDTFVAMGTILPLLLLFCQVEISGTQFNPIATSIMQAILLAAFGIGCYVAGRLSVKKIEPGLVPFGALGMAVAMILASFFYGPVLTFQLEIPKFGIFQPVIPVGAILFLLLVGLAGGLFVTPLRTYFQQRLRRESRGMSLAFYQMIRSALMGLFAWLLLYCQRGTLVQGGVNRILPVSSGPDVLNASTIVMILGTFTLLVTFFSMWAMPDFTLRFLIISLGNTIYKLRITGAENIPSHGPALIISNHVSFVDNILLSACTSRRIRFLMGQNMLEKSRSLRLLARLTGFIVVPNARHRNELLQMFDKIQNALRAGDIICVFPEGLPTRNSLIGEFKAGYQKMLPPDMDVPIIPVHIGDMWGSRFSYFHNRFDFDLPLRRKHAARITFGKPMPKDSQPYQVRRRICELAAESATKTIRFDEHPLHVQLAYNQKRFPFRTLFRDAESGKSFSYYKVMLASLLLSREFRKLFTPEDERVGIMMPNCSVAAMAILGVLYSDRVPCVLNFTTPRPVLEETLKKANIRHIITSHKFLAKINYPENENMIFLEDMMPRIPGWKKIAFLLGIFLIPTRELMNLFCPLSHEDVNRVATVLFSSGSTGKPKGVVLTHHNINCDMYPLVEMVCPDLRTCGFLGNLPLFHSFGMNICFWIPVSIGAPITYVMSPLDAALTGKVIERDKLTLLFATPSFLQTYLRKCKPEQFKSMLMICTGAEKLREDIKKKFNDFIGGRLQIIEGYGCTELAPVATLNVSRDVQEMGQVPGKAGSIGPAIGDTAIKVVDPITYEELPPDTEGLMFVKGPMVMQGYLNQPKETEKALINGYYNTGDIITMDAKGYVTICGRLSRFSKIAGEMVPHEMVECIINELCGTDARVVAVGSIPDPQKGEALCVLYTPEMPMTPDEVVAELRERSISNLWIPKAGNFVPVEKLPILGTGKLDLSVLRKVTEQIAVERNLKGSK